MKNPFLILLSILTLQAGYSQTLRSILLEQIKTTHNNKDWFVPINASIEGLTADQASWNDGSGNHSIAQLTNHLIFWNLQQLAKMKGEKAPAFNGDNNETFSSVDKTTWESSVKRIDSVMIQLEKLLQTASESNLKKWATNFAHIATHNAYHTGQILYIRKEQHSWDEAKGVK